MKKQKPLTHMDNLRTLAKEFPLMWTGEPQFQIILKNYIETAYLAGKVDAREEDIQTLKGGEK